MGRQAACVVCGVEVDSEAAGGSLNQTGVPVLGVVIREERLAEDDRVLGGPGLPGNAAQYFEGLEG